MLPYRPRRALVFLAFLALAVLAGAGCGSDDGGASDEGRLQVVATSSIVADLTEEVGGDRVAVTTLVGRDQDAHAFEPTPGESVALSEGDLVVENGLGFEPWLDDLYDASDSDAPRVVLAEGVTPRTVEEGDDEEIDPHIWHSVPNAEIMVQNLRDALVAADPDGTGVYGPRADAYLRRLDELDAEVRRSIASIPSDRRVLVTSHDTFGYYADEYGLEVLGSGLGSVTTEASDPSAADVAQLVRDIRAADVPAIFAENIASSDLLERVAKEAGVTLAPPLYTDALGPEVSDGATYVEMIRHNTRVIADALGGA
jgi:zinc/manganese transport system substrate-binding protein